MEAKSDSRKTVIIISVGLLVALLVALVFMLNSGEKVIPAARKTVTVTAKPLKPAVALSLHDAAKLGNMTPIVQHLRDGEDVNGLDSKGRTPLDLAVENGHQKTAELLLANGADINLANSAGETPLHIAAANGHKDLAAMLIAKGADLNATDKSGQTPLQLAAKKGHDEMAAFLKSLSQTATTTRAS